MREDGQGSKEQQQQNWQERKDRKRESAAMRGEDRAAGEGRWEERVNRTFHEPLTQMRREIDAEIPTENMTFAVLRGALREATLEDREMFSRLQEHATGMNATAEHALFPSPLATEKHSVFSYANLWRTKILSCIAASCATVCPSAGEASKGFAPSFKS